MQLTFLGNRYEANSSPIPVVEGQRSGKYRGQAWLGKHFKELLIPQSDHRLKYRGVEYLGTIYSRGNKTTVSVASELIAKQIDSPQVFQRIKNTENKNKVAL